MAGIEDFVVNGIMHDMEQQRQPKTLEEAIAMGDTAAQAQMSSFSRDAQYAGRMRQTGLPDGAVVSRGTPLGFTIADPAARERYAQYSAQLAAAVAADRMHQEALQKRDAARITIMQAMKGLDPQIQATILKRLGIGPGVVKSEVEQKKELMQFQQQLQQPQQEAANKLKMLGLQRQLGQDERELGLRERQFQAETAGRSETRNIQLMRVLAMMMQANPQLQATIGPMLLQLMQASGINLAPPSAAGQPRTTSGRGAFSPRPGVTITQEE